MTEGPFRDEQLEKASWLADARASAERQIYYVVEYSHGFLVLPTPTEIERGRIVAEVWPAEAW